MQSCVVRVLQTAIVQDFQLPIHVDGYLSIYIHRSIVLYSNVQVHRFLHSHEGNYGNVRNSVWWQLAASVNMYDNAMPGSRS